MEIPEVLYHQLKQEVDQFFINLQIDNSLITIRSFSDPKNFLLILKVKIIQIHEQKCQRFDYDLDINYIKTSCAFNNIIYHCLFIQRTDHFLNKLLRYLDQDLELTELKILETILDYGFLQNKDLIETHFKRTHLKTRLIQTLGSDEKVLRNKVADIIPKYCSFIGTNEILKEIFNKGSIDTICIFNKYLNEILGERSFWDLIYNGLTTDKKKALYLLKGAINFIFTSNQLEFLKGETKALDREQLENNWKNFFILFETSQEKQIHLIVPVLGLYDQIILLNQRWKYIIIRQFLFHSQNAIRRKAVTNVLSKKWEAEPGLLLLTLNNTFLYEHEPIKKLINSYVEDVVVVDFVKELENINLQPIPMYFLLKDINATSSKTVIRLLEIVSRNKISYIQNFLNVNILKCCRRLNDQESLEELNNVALFLINSPKSLRYCFYKLVLNESRLYVENKSKTSQNVPEWNGNYINLPIILLYSQNNHDYNRFFTSDHKTVELALDIAIFSTSEGILPENFYESSALVNLIENFVENEVNQQKVDEGVKSGSIFNETGTNLIEILSNASHLVKKVLFKLVKAERFDLVLDLSAALFKTSNVCRFFVDEDRFYDIVKDVDTFKDRFIKDRLHPLYIYMLAFNDPSFLEALSDFLDVNGPDYFLFIANILIHFITNPDKPPVLRTSNPVILVTIMKKLQSEFFFRGANSFLLYNYYDLLKYQLRFDHFDENVNIFVQKVFENNHNYSDYSYLRKLFLKVLNATFNHDKELIYKHKDVIVNSIINCPLFTRDQRIEFDVCSEIKKSIEGDQIWGVIQSENNSEADSYVRLYAIWIALKIGGSIHYNDCLKYIIDQLKTRYTSIAGKRYYENSQNHLTKLRILQFFNLIFDYIDLDKLRTLSEWLLDNLLNEPHQTNVKVLIQWFLSKAFIKITNDYNALVNNLIKRVKNHGASASALFPILYNILRIDQSKIYEVIMLLAGYSMGPNFKTRYAAQLAIKYIWENIKLDEKYRLIYQVALEAVHETEVAPNVDLAYIDLSTINFNMIYFYLPQRTNVEKYQWAIENASTIRSFPDYDSTFDQIFTQSNLSSLELPLELDKLKIYKDDFSETETIVQKKYSLDLNPNKIDSNLILVGSLIDKVPNLGGLSRTCEIFGIKEFIVNNVSVVKNKEYQSLSMSSENWVRMNQVKLEELPSYLKKMKEEGYRIVGAEQTTDSQNLESYKFEKNTILVLGNEKEGIPPNLIHLLDNCIEIPQFGQLRSLNVHVAGALLIWEYTKQMLNK